MISALLLASAGPAQYGPSPLVDDNPQHDWIALAEEGDAGIWWDGAAVLSRAIGESDYPTVLIRVVFAGEDRPLVYQDALLAVDCKQNQFAEIELLVNGRLVDMPVGTRVEKPKFRPLPNPELSETQTLMRRVCGKDWTP